MTAVPIPRRRMRPPIPVVRGARRRPRRPSQRRGSPAPPLCAAWVRCLSRPHATPGACAARRARHIQSRRRRPTQRCGRPVLRGSRSPATPAPLRGSRQGSGPPLGPLCSMPQSVTPSGRKHHAAWPSWWPGEHLEPSLLRIDTLERQPPPWRPRPPPMRPRRMRLPPLRAPAVLHRWSSMGRMASSRYAPHGGVARHAARDIPSCPSRPHRLQQRARRSPRAARRSREQGWPSEVRADPRGRWRPHPTSEKGR